MSAQGQKRRFGDVGVPSAFPLKADTDRKGRHVSNVPRTHSRVVMRRCLGIDHGPPVTYQYALLNIPQTSISAESFPSMKTRHDSASARLRASAHAQQGLRPL